ncbi:MAG: methylated-DNA--[protein]-cysteine S-methyltransferase [Acidimicrobiia bacterium]|nr:methylated-DNA--[protein]-cysteine S-methyltransferase [Acidimicrobiia bacterium]NNL69270.1 methylated-DNA--[protein]-cysteine S-methyltransferase [Acidimicrobiia bacterium]
MSTQRELAALATTAPESIAPAVLLETGLADGYLAYAGPAGPMFVSFNARGISSLTLGTDPEAFEEKFVELFGRPAVPVKALPKRLGRALEKTLETGRIGSLPIDWDGMSEFQQAVLRKTAEILPGEVRPYSWIAREIGKPKAVRAVGTALARNPIPIVVPCHRVVRNDGNLGNYYYGTDVKRAVLESEGLDVDTLEDLSTRGVRLTGSDTTHIFCNPTCRDARRTTDRHLVEFRSEAEARAAGYRPCKHCRPAAA